MARSSSPPSSPGRSERPTPAFADVVCEQRAAVFRFAMTMTRNEALAEDVLQETFLSAYRAWGTFRGEAHVRTWLFTIARNAALRLMRRRAGEPAAFDDVSALGESAGWGTPELPDEVLARREQRACLKRTLSQLSDPDREVIVLRDVEGFTTTETAQILAISPAAVRSRLHRARLKFLATLRQGGSGGD